VWNSVGPGQESLKELLSHVMCDVNGVMCAVCGCCLLSLSRSTLLANAVRVCVFCEQDCHAWEGKERTKGLSMPIPLLPLALPLFLSLSLPPSWLTFYSFH